MPNYENGKIYRLICNLTGMIYIGSTTQPLSKRLASHVEDHKSGRIKASSSPIIAGGDYSIVLIESYPCHNSDELRMRERYYMENTLCINKNIPYTSDEEKREYYKDYKKEEYKYQPSYICDCGEFVRIRYSEGHQLTAKHREYMATHPVAEN